MSSEHRINLQPAYLLHSKPFRDTSLILEVFSRDHGRLGLVARGAKGKRPRFRGVLQPYQYLLLSWSGRGELPSLTAAETQSAPILLHGDALLSGFYLNELLLRLLARHDPHPELFFRYQHTLGQLALNNDIGWTLRLFERDLLQELGYGLLLTHEAMSGAEIEPDARYCYHHDSGPQRMFTEDGSTPGVRGAALIALATGECHDSQLRRECKRLMREVLGNYLGPRPLASRELFRQKRPKKQEE